MAIRAARLASPLGILTLLGEGAYQGGKYMLERKELLESLTDQQRDELLSKEKTEAVMQNKRGDPEAFSGIMAANGGLISRQGFADGPEDPKMNRRTFMKVMGGLASIPVLGKLMKPAAKVVESAAPVVKETLAGAPEHFLKLVAKIKALGKDFTPKYGSQPRENVTLYKDYKLTEQLDSGRTTIQRTKDSEIDYYDEILMEETYMDYIPGKNLADETTRGKNIPDEYIEDTSYMRTSGPQKGDIMETVSGVPDDIFEEVGEAVPEAVRKK